MLRRIELGAGVASGVLAVLGFAMILFAPLVPYCAEPGVLRCPAANVRYTSAVRAGLTGGAWALTLLLLAIILLGTLGTLVDVSARRAWGIVLLWPSAIFTFAICAYAAGGVGIIYLPAVLGVGLATYVSVLARIRERRAAAAPPETPAARPASQP